MDVNPWVRFVVQFRSVVTASWIDTSIDPYPTMEQAMARAALVANSRVVERVTTDTVVWPEQS